MVFITPYKMVEKTRVIDVYKNKGIITSIFKKFSIEKKNYNYYDLSHLRQILSNEKMRLLNVIKNEKPNSLYALAKKLGKDFKTVREDVLLLKKFGFIILIEEKKGNRRTHRTVLVADTINIIINI